MPHDVFISHSKQDKPTADAACAALEVAGIRCWIAPRDVLPGTTWSGSIVRAIGDSRIMVLVFSSNSNGSQQVLREVDCAVNEGVVVVPFRIEAVHPSDDMKFYLSTPHWLDAITPPLAAHLKELCRSVQALLPTLRDRRVVNEAAPVPTSFTSKAPQSQAADPERMSGATLETVASKPQFSSESRAVRSRLLNLIPRVQVTRPVVVAAIVLILLAVLVSEVIQFGSHRNERGSIYPFFFLLASFPLIAIVLSRRWQVSTRFKAFLLGWLCAVGVAAIASIVLAFLTFIFSEPLRISMFYLFWSLGAIATIAVGLIRAFLMMPNPKSSERVHP